MLVRRKYTFLAIATIYTILVLLMLFVLEEPEKRDIKCVKGDDRCIPFCCKDKEVCESLNTKDVMKNITLKHRFNIDYFEVAFTKPTCSLRPIGDRPWDLRWVKINIQF
jgi:hypothetical protein